MKQLINIHPAADDTELLSAKVRQWGITKLGREPPGQHRFIFLLISETRGWKLQTKTFVLHLRSTIWVWRFLQLVTKIRKSIHAGFFTPNMVKTWLPRWHVVVPSFALLMLYFFRCSVFGLFGYLVFFFVDYWISFISWILCNTLLPSFLTHRFLRRRLTKKSM